MSVKALMGRSIGFSRSIHYKWINVCTTKNLISHRSDNAANN